MTLFKAFVRIRNKIFQSHSSRLVFGYLVAMTTILGNSGIILYFFFARSLQQQLDSELLTLARAAAPTINTVKTQGLQSLDKDIPWRNLFSHREQSLEWYDAQSKMLAQEGTLFSQFSSPLQQFSSQLSQNQPLFQQQNSVRSVTIAIYADDEQGKTQQLEGYIRASQSTYELEMTLTHLRLGLLIGGVIAITLVSCSCLYLTQKAIEPMQTSLKQLKLFTAESSHELRNPLTKIAVASEMLLTHSEDFGHFSEIRKLEIIRNAAQEMQSLVEDLLFLARTDAASLSNLEGSKLRLDELLLALIEKFELQAQNKKITLTMNLIPKVYIKGNTSQLSRLFTNLLENAIKYTRPGGRVTVLLQQSQQSAIVSVEDTGIGMEPEELSCVFQRFWRAERVKTQKEKGSGLGLAIAQSIALQHRGEITVNSQLGIGSCFRVRIPLP